MRPFWLVPALTIAACAHAPRPIEPERWRELQTEHFVIRTDLPPQDAHRVAVDLEEVRAALFAAAWHGKSARPGRTQVIVLADDSELQEYAIKGIEGFVASDAFGEPIMVVSGSQDPEEQRFLKHELAHVITNEFLVRNPRWVSEGISCYLETLHFDRRQGKVVIGESSRDRLQYLQYEPVYRYWSVLQTGREAERMSAREGWAFETGAWALVHWLVDERGKSFDSMLNRLANGEDRYYAFSASFPDLSEDVIKAGVGAWLKRGKPVLYTADAPRWSGAVTEHVLPRAEVYAVLADLMRLSPGYPNTAERDMRMRSLLALAAQEDPGHPLALRLADSADYSAATVAHPDDWRAWLLYADRNNHELAASRKAADLAPENPTVVAHLAIAEEMAGKVQDALGHASHALEISPGRSDLLAVFGIALAANGRCEDGSAYAQRAIDVLPDGAPPAAVVALKKTQQAIHEHCTSAAITRTVERRVLGTPKGCDPAGPRLGRRDSVKGPVKADFVVHPDGTVGEVIVTGAASAGALAAVKRYIEACRYEPLEQSGKPMESRWHLDFDLRK